MIIDPHVHFRDFKESYKETVAHGLYLAKTQGVDKVFDMPNTNPAIISEKIVKERLKLVPKERKNDYFLFIGATTDKNQLREAVKCYEKYKEVVGIKMYAGRSVGNFAGISSVSAQEKVYKTLSLLDYKGVIAVHCEKEEFIAKKIFNPEKPITHYYSRKEKAEIESIKDQVKLALKSNFKGVVHIVHISLPESVELVNKAKKKIKITCAVTPHYILWSNEMLKRPDGLLYKINPPLRKKKDVLKLRKYLKDGKIDWLESDYAPYPIGEKLFSPYQSGFPSLYLYKDLVRNFLPKLGISKRQIEKLTFGNIYKVFESKLKGNI